MTGPGPASHLVVDIGKSQTRVQLQHTAYHRIGPGASPEGAAAPGAGRVLAELVDRACADLDSPVGRVTVGTTFLPDPAGLEEARARLSARWPGAAVDIFADGVLAHAAALGAPGTVATIGTGTAVLGLDSAGRLRQKDCWGPDLGDRGSAAELGRAGLRMACASIDEVAAAPGLEQAGTRWFGRRLDIRAAAELLAGPDRVRRLASFARVVCELAAEGDPAAAALVRQAAEAAADTCAAMARSVGESTIVVLGRLAEMPAYRRQLTLALDRAVLHERPAVSAVLQVSARVLDLPAYRAWVGRSPLPG